jgi:hypothetical protein
MASSNIARYRLQPSAEASADAFNLIYGGTPDLVAVYHFTDFTSVCQLQQLTMAGLDETWSSVTATVTVVGFSTSYGSSDALFCRGGTNGQFTIYGQHQGVFQQELWYVRNSAEQNGRDSSGATRTEFTTVKPTVKSLPTVYHAGYRAVPDRTLSTGITMTVNLRLGSTSQGTSLTISAISQTVLNDWNRFRLQIRPFVQAGTAETGNVTSYRTSTFVNLPAATFAVTNTTSVTSGATITVRFAQPHNVASGSIVVVAITSTATNHSFAQGTFFTQTWPTTSSFTYTVTSIGSISTTTSLLGAVGYYR